MSIRDILMSLSTGLAVLALSLSPAGPARAAARSASADGARMDLPAPDKTGGMPLMRALAERRSSKSGYTGAPLSARELSNLLWATWGVNRPDGRRTAPSAMNRQEVSVYVALESGVWRYDAAGHALVRELDGDHRRALGGGSLALLYAAPEGRWSGMHVGSLYQNAGLYCASAGLGNYVHASGASALDGKLSLPDGWRVLIVQTVGLMK